MEELDFIYFLTENNGFDDDTAHSIKKLPKSHQKLVKGYKITFQKGNTLKGDGGHVGIIDEKKKTIVIASPWNYSREMTLLHEVAHLVWKFKLNGELKERWNKICQKTKDKENKGALDQNGEELFCMAYAANYAKTPPVVFSHASWKTFIKNLPN